LWFAASTTPGFTPSRLFWWSALEPCFPYPRSSGVAIALVWVAEAINTALELLADAVNPQPHPLVGQAKDVAAGAVLIAAVAAAGVGLIVLGPHCLDLIGL